MKLIFLANALLVKAIKALYYILNATVHSHATIKYT